jgi:hypothetical protein
MEIDLERQAKRHIEDASESGCKKLREDGKQEEMRFDHLTFSEEDFSLSKAEFLRKHASAYGTNTFHLGQYYDEHFAFHHITSPLNPDVETIVDRPFSCGQGVAFCSMCKDMTEPTLLDLGANRYCFVCSACKKVESLYYLPRMHCSWCSKWIPENWNNFNGYFPEVTFRAGGIRISCTKRCKQALETFFHVDSKENSKWIEIPDQ